MKNFNSYMETLQDAYNELMSALDPLHYKTKKREWDGCIFYLKLYTDGTLGKWYHNKGYQNFDNIEIHPDNVAELKANFKAQESKRSKNAYKTRSFAGIGF